MIVPFKSLRYHGGRNQTWGFQVRRSIRRKNEWACLTALPASMGGPLGFNRVSLYGSLTGSTCPKRAVTSRWRIGVLVGGGRRGGCAPDTDALASRPVALALRQFARQKPLSRN